MMREQRLKTGFFKTTAIFLASAFVAGPSAAAAATAAEVPSPESGAYSVRLIPEALPLSSAIESDGWSAALRYGDQDAEPQQELSATKAIFYSFLIPGLGDWYAGRKDRAKTFFIVDAAIWTAFIVFEVQGYQREEGYKEYAQIFAGVQSTDHSDDFYSTIGQYASSEEYESDFKKDSRLDLWPDVGSEAMESYYLENRVADFEDWAWQSFESRVDYRQMRSSSKLSYRRADYMIAAAVLNRMVASVFAYQAVKSSRGKAKEQGDSQSGGVQGGGYRLDISTPVLGERGDFTTRVSLIRSF